MSQARDDFYKWLTNELKDKGWQFAEAGHRFEGLGPKRAISLSTGFWENVNYNLSKPVRWLVRVDVRGLPTIRVSVYDDERAKRIGFANTSQNNAVGIAVRLVPVFQTGTNSFHVEPGWEWTLQFHFPYPVPGGKSAEVFSYDAASGVLRYRDDPVEYVFAGLYGLRLPDDSIALTNGDVTYGQVTRELRDLLHVKLLGSNAPPGKISFYDLSQEDGPDVAILRTAIGDAIANAPAPPTPRTDGAGAAAEPEEEDEGPADVIVDVPEDPELLGIDPSVYRQINTALRSGKQHLMFYGPPGTGKTTLARWVATTLAGPNWMLVTGSADWSSQDIIGGYQPVGDGEVKFIPGVLLKAFDQPFIIDEMNRCDIDKVLGPLFTVLSGHHTSLQYRTEISDPDSQPYVILPSPKAGKAKHEFAPGERWRLIATINSIDKASLHQMSYALMRRFGWVYVDAPRDKDAFLRQFMQKKTGAAPSAGTPCPLAAIWESVNKVRVLGPAPFIDSVNAVLAMDANADIFQPATPAMAGHLLDAFDMFVLPLMDGILRHEANQLAGEIGHALGFAPGSEEAKRIEARLGGVSV